MSEISGENVMIDPLSVGQDALKVGVAAVAGWLASRLMLSKQLDAFESRVIQPIRDKVSKFDAAGYATRDDVRMAMLELKADLKEAVMELKTMVRDLRPHP